MVDRTDDSSMELFFLSPQHTVDSKCLTIVKYETDKKAVVEIGWGDKQKGEIG